MIELVRSGETLVRTMIDGEAFYHLRPSCRDMPKISVEEAIATGELVPGEDGLLPGVDQTWRAR